MASRGEARIEAAGARIRTETGAAVHALAADVSRGADVEGLVAACVDRLGGLDIAVHNAGGPPAGDTASISDEQWQRAFEANLLSFVRLARAAAPEMKKGGYGRLIAIASSSIKQPIPNLVLSNTLRTGVVGLAKTLASELAPDGILVNVVAPGRIRTERMEELDRAAAERAGTSIEEVRRASIASIPLGRLGRPEELANLVVFLASGAATYITGTAIQVDGGLVRSIL
jgi:3-oxoacyl-[acyl-carrier protein] reductase